MLFPILGFAVEERHGHTAVGSVSDTDMTKDWSICYTKKGSEGWGCLRLEKIYTHIAVCRSRIIKNLEPDPSQWYKGKEHEARGINSNIGNSI